MDLKGIALSEESHLPMALFIHHSQNDKAIEMENRSVVARDWDTVRVAQIQRGSTEELFCVDGTVLYLDCGGNYTHVYVG